MLDQSDHPPRPPPRRSSTAGAARARQSRARLKAGIATFRMRAHKRRLAAAMRAANHDLPDDLHLDHAAMELELGEIIAAFVERWPREK